MGVPCSKGVGYAAGVGGWGRVGGVKMDKS